MIGEVDPGVICIAVEIYAIFGKNIAKGKEVNDGEEAPWGRALGHT